MSGRDRLDDPRAEAAVTWMVEMRDGAMSERQIQRFEAWLQADPRNEAAWIRLQEGLMPLGIASRRGLSHDLLARKSTSRGVSRRTLLTGIVGVTGLGAAGGALVQRFVPLGNVMADHVTGTAEQRRIGLADGSELVLAPRTAVNVRYETGLRCVQLLDGEMLVRAASRATPFGVDLGALSLRTNAGVFVAENRDADAAVTGVEGLGELSGPGTGGPLRIAAGELVESGGGRLRRLSADTRAATAWTDRILVARDRPLAALVDRLRPYFPGIIRIDPSVAALRVTGVFPLDDPNIALDALAASLGLSIRRVARYWVSLGPGRR